MDRPYPNRRRAMFALRVLLILGSAGCSNQQMSASNPFMSPDRVPPPATRTIAPGTAAPYYPGDPIPAAQVPPAPGAVPMVAQAQPPITTAASPGFAAVPQSPVSQSPVPQPPAPQPLEFTNERSVSIPSDGADLRFAAAPPATPIQPQPPATQSIAAAPAPTQQVVPVGYNQPVASQPAPAASLVPSAADDTSGGPWRAPQIPGGRASSGTMPVTQAQYVQPQPPSPWQIQPPPQQLQPVPQTIAPASTMPVQLRAVPSPAPMTPSVTTPAMASAVQVAPAPTPPPRMRFPSWTEPSTWFTPQPATTGPAPGQQLVGYMVPGPNGQMQMVSVEQMQAMTAGGAQPPASVANADGFRARGSVTK